MNRQRLAPLSGLVFVGLMAVVLGFAGATPGNSDSPAKITSFYLAHHNQQSIISFVLALSVVFLVFFAAAVDRVLRAGGSGEDALGRIVFLAGAALAAAGFIVVSAVHFALSEGVHDHISPVAAQALTALDANDFLIFTSGLGVMLIGVAVRLIPKPVARPWLGWTAFLIGVVSFTPAAFGAFIASGIWIAAASITLSARGHRASAERAPRRPVPAAAQG